MEDVKKKGVEGMWLGGRSPLLLSQATQLLFRLVLLIKPGLSVY